MIGIIIPMDSELEAFRKYFTEERNEKYFDTEFLIGKVKNKDVVVVRCGVGKVHAARTTQLLLCKYDVECVLNMGIAGGVDESLNVLDIVIGNKFVQHDFDISIFDHRKGYIPDIGDEIYADKKIVDLAYNSFTDDTFKVHVGGIASGDQFISDAKVSKFINEYFGCLCAEMESAAIAQVCKLCNTPYLIIRSISDVPGKTKKMEYDEFEEKSCNMIADFVYHIIENIKS